MKRNPFDCCAVYVKKSADGEPMYRNYDMDEYDVGEIVAIFGCDNDARDYAKNFKGYSGNVVANVCGVHRLTWPGDIYNKFWKDAAEPYLGDAFAAHWGEKNAHLDDEGRG